MSLPPPTLDPYRARLYRVIFSLAAVYNLAFGIWTIFWPAHVFQLFRLPPSNYPEIWQCLGMVVGLYGVGYAYAAWRLDRGQVLIAIGLAGKVLGPIGLLLTAGAGNWPLRTFTMNMFNDLIWWVPFSLYLLEGTRLGRAIRASTPVLCALLNAAASVAMLLALQGGTEAVPVVAERIAYIAEHPILWRGGWLLWCMAAISLIGLFAWWGARVPSANWALAAFLVAIAGLTCDLFFESLFIGWLPDDYEAIYPAGARAMGIVANGCYSIAGIMLTLCTQCSRHTPCAAADGTRSVPATLTRTWFIWTWAVWLSGLALVAAVAASNVTAIIVTTAVMMGLFCPWAACLPWKLHTAGSSSPAD